MKKEKKEFITTLIGILIFIGLFLATIIISSNKENRLNQEITHWQYEAVFNAGYINGMKNVLMLTDTTYNGTTNNIFRNETPVKNKRGPGIF